MSRTQLVTLLALVALSLRGGPDLARADDPARGQAPLPPLNAKVAEFARSHEGKSVGDGICITLAVEALQAAGAKRLPLDDPAGEYVWGAPVVDLRSVLPGDILQFRDAEFQGVRVERGHRQTFFATYAHHTAVVTKVAENGRLVTICHQNIAEAGDAPGARERVRATTLRMNALQRGTIRAYRPLPPDPDPALGPPADHQ